ncbi:MAG: SO_0444 family Cu/Zn efflux transporter [Desulfobacterales bacterium]
MELWITTLGEGLRIFIDSSPYVLFGLLLSGLLHTFLDARTVVRHLGSGRVSSVVKAAALGIPLPLCSCGVLPAAVSLRRQGATRGATTAFLISTPETGADSIAVSWALLDPLLTAARPLAAFFTAVAAGVAENFFGRRGEDPGAPSPTSGSVPEGLGAPEERLSPGRKIQRGLRYATGELWGDLAPWYFLGILLAGAVLGVVPEGFIETHLGSGWSAMGLMLLAGLPLYVCATASTPLAAALILKGVSPGAALVFLLAGPATNLATLTVLLGTIGKRATALYLVAIAAGALASGAIVDRIYAQFEIPTRAVIGRAAEAVPEAVRVAAAVILALVSLPPLLRLARRSARRLLPRRRPQAGGGRPPTPCGCGPGCGRHSGIAPR